jgi:hypothetical protein
MRKSAPAGLLLAGLFFLSCGDAFAGRTPSVRTSGMRMPGVKGDQSVPYLTTGKSAFMSTTYVAPKVMESPQLNNPRLPAVEPTFNLQFWSGVEGMGDDFNSAVPRTSSHTFPLGSTRFYLFR